MNKDETLPRAAKRPVDSDAEKLEDFAKAIRGLHAHRVDIKTWFDFLDLDDNCYGSRSQSGAPRPDLNRGLQPRLSREETRT